MKPIPRFFSHARLVAVALSLTAATATAQQPTLSELLEKGIYAEETKGDIDAAITIYQKLILDAKTAQALAAQAQFRLGQCYLKKNRTAEATAAFERLIKEHPDQKELIAKARKHVPGELQLAPAPWSDGEFLHLSLKVPGGLDIGATAYYAQAAEQNGRKIWQVGSRLFAKVHSVSRVEATQDEFKPLSSWWKHGMLGEVTATYHENSVELKMAGQNETTTVPVDGPVYDNEQVVHLMRRLPLEVGYKTTLPVVSTLSGGRQIPIVIEVKAKETVKVPAGTWEAFKVELPGVSQSFWFSADEKRYPVKFQGGGVNAELITIEHRKPGEPVPFTDKELGIELTAPSGWLIHKQEPDMDPKVTSIYLLDPKAEAEGVFLKIHTLESLPEDQRKSARAWAEGSASKLKNFLKEFQVRPDSWKDLTVSGKPAVGFLADYKENDKPMVLAAVYTQDTDSAEQFSLMVDPAHYEALKGAFDSIVSSYKATK